MVLGDAGSLSREKAFDKAGLEYKKYQENTLSEVEKVFLESVKGLDRKIKNNSKK